MSESIQRQIDRLPNEAEAALARLDRTRVSERANAILALDSGNGDARALLGAAARSGVGVAATAPSPPHSAGARSAAGSADAYLPRKGT